MSIIVSIVAGGLLGFATNARRSIGGILDFIRNVALGVGGALIGTKLASLFMAPAGDGGHLFALVVPSLIDTAIALFVANRTTEAWHRPQGSLIWSPGSEIKKTSPRSGNLPVFPEFPLEWIRGIRLIS